MLRTRSGLTSAGGIARYILHFKIKSGDFVKFVN